MKQYYDIISDLRELWLKLLKSDFDKSKEISQFLIFAMAKSDKTVRSVKILCENGHGEDATILSRSLLELYINTKYILSKNNDNLAKRFFEYDWILREKIIPYLSAKNIKENSKQIEDIKERAKNFKNQYGIKNKNFSNWSGKSFLEICKILKLENVYYPAYKIMCSSVHTDSRDINNYIKQDLKNRNLTLINNKNNNLVKESLYSSIINYWNILECFNDYYKKDYGKNLYDLHIKIKGFNQSLTQVF